MTEPLDLDELERLHSEGSTDEWEPRDGEDPHFYGRCALGPRIISDVFGVDRAAELAEADGVLAAAAVNALPALIAIAREAEWTALADQLPEPGREILMWWPPRKSLGRTVVRVELGILAKVRDATGRDCDRDRLSLYRQYYGAAYGLPGHEFYSGPSHWRLALSGGTP